MSRRTGFVMRGFIPLGPLTVSRGLGGVGGLVIEEEEREDAFSAGRKRTVIYPTTRVAPKIRTVKGRGSNGSSC